MELTFAIYKATKSFPEEEKYGLTSQMRRCAVSIPSNIAEGKYRSSRKDYAKFLQIAFASGAELETQIEIATYLKYKKDFSKINQLLSEIMKMLNAMIRNLKSY